MDLESDVVGLDPAAVNNEMETDEAAMNFKNNRNKLKENNVTLQHSINYGMEAKVHTRIVNIIRLYSQFTST